MQKKTVIPLVLPFLVGAIGHAIGADFLSDSVDEPKLQWANRIKMGGTVEVDANYENHAGSSLSVGTLELTMDARINDWTEARVVLLHEEGADQDVMVDEATITVGNPESTPLYVTAGKMAVPFGNFSTQLLSDPLTLELAETKRNALLIGFEREGWKGSSYMFDGESQRVGKGNRLDQYGVSLGYAMEMDDMALDVGIAYINAMENSDGVSDALVERLEVMPGYIGGLSTHAIFSVGPYSLVGEYISALDDFDSQGVRGVKPQAWNSEFGYSFGFLEREASLALGYQGTRDAHFLELPEERLSGGVSVALEENTSLGFEFYHDEGYSSDDQEGVDTDSATVRLAVSF